MGWAINDSSITFWAMIFALAVLSTVESYATEAALLLLLSWSLSVAL